MAEARAQYMVAADASARAGQTREALDVLQRIADLDPANTQVRLRLAEAYTREELPELAADAYTLAGERLAARGDFDNALDAFTKALALRPVSHAALAGLLAAHTELGTADEAAEILEEAAAERPDDVEVRAMLVRAYVEAEDGWRAEAAAKEVVERAEAAGDREGERRALTRLARLEPSEAGYRTRLEELGGPLFDEDEGAGRGSEMPTFESFV